MVGFSVGLCERFEVEAVRGRRRGRKKEDEFVKEDLVVVELKLELDWDRLCGFAAESDTPYPCNRCMKSGHKKR